MNAALIAFALQQATPAPQAEIRLLGIGGSSCASNMAVSDDSARVAWVFGFWTAMNYAKDANVGGSTDPRGIYAEVELLCSQQPSLTLAVATYRTYARLAAAKR